MLNFVNMKRYIIVFLVISSGFIPNSYAAYGNAKDGYLFALCLIGILLLVAGILFFIDFLKKNGKHLIENLHSHMQTHQ